VFVFRAHASLLQEELTAKILHHLQTSHLHWAELHAGMDMPVLAQSAEIWTEEPVASIVFHSVNHCLNLAAHRSCRFDLTSDSCSLLLNIAASRSCMIYRYSKWRLAPRDHDIVVHQC
jgi:tRNA threonylcarbamoyladenosine modification (KEOPS) complex  Pcc1 subunit